MATDKTTTPFLKIKDACAVTGLSQYFLRKGCKDGRIPHIRSGPTYYINVPELMKQLGVPPQSEAGVTQGR